MSLRNNILFGNPMNATKYEEIIDACALRADLDILPAKDMTEIGEKVIHLYSVYMWICLKILIQNIRLNPVALKKAKIV